MLITKFLKLHPLTFKGVDGKEDPHHFVLDIKRISYDGKLIRRLCNYGIISD